MIGSDDGPEDKVKPGPECSQEIPPRTGCANKGNCVESNKIDK